MSVYLTCSETGGPCYENPNWATCPCDDCVTYRKQLNRLDTNMPTPEPGPEFRSKEWWDNIRAEKQPPTSSVSDGSTAAYYELPTWARELADLIRYKKMNGSQAEMFRALYRGSEASHSDEKRQAKKLLAYAVDEVVRTHFPEESFAFYRNGVFEAIFGELK